MLAAGSGRPIGIDSQILVLNFYFNVVRNLWIDEHRCEARFTARSGVERTEPNEPVHPGFGHKQPVGVLAAGGERGRFDSRFLAGLFVDNLGLESAPLTPTEIHAEQHSGPILGIGAARSRIYGHDRIASIIGSGQQCFSLCFFNVFFEFIESALQFAERALVITREFEEHAGIIDLPAKLLGFLYGGLETAARFQDCLRAFLIVPEVWFCKLFFEFGEFLPLGFGVKETSAIHRRGLKAFRTFL